jgi:hypothetical protein
MAGYYNECDALDIAYRGYFAYPHVGNFIWHLSPVIDDSLNIPGSNP